MPLPSFSLPANGQLSPDSVQRRRRIAEAMLSSGMDFSPIASPWQGAARLGQAFVGGYGIHKADQQEQQGHASANDAILKALADGNPNMSQLAELSGNEYLTPGQQGIVGAMAKNLIPQPQDPYTLGPGQQRFGSNNQLVAQVPQQPDPFTLSPGQTHFDANGQPMAQMPEAAPDPYSLSPGEARYDGNGNLISQQPPKDETTPITILYDRYSKQERAAGREPMPIDQFAMMYQKSGASSVNVDTKGQGAWETESAKLFAKRYDDIGVTAGKAQEMMGLYDIADEALSNGVRTGSFAAYEQGLRRLGVALGIGDEQSINALASGELLTSITNRMALQMRNPDSGMGLPGAVSDRDLLFLKQAQVGIDRLPEGNRQMLKAFRRLEERRIEIAQLADHYVEQARGEGRTPTAGEFNQTGSAIRSRP